MLAQEVRTGKLGGICTVNAVFQGGAAAFDAGSEGNDGSGGSSLGHAASHCALCGALGLAMPPLLVVAIGSFAGTQVVGFALPTPGAAAIPGLPFSRGPPAL